MTVKRFSQHIYTVAACLLFAAVVQINAQGIGARSHAGNGGSMTIMGKVWLPDGTPAIGVKVSLSSSDVNTSTWTDPEGMYTFGDIPGGNYTVSVKVEGLAEETASYSIDQDAAAAGTISLPLYLRNLGQKRGDFISGNPIFKDVPKDALAKYVGAGEKIGKNDSKSAVDLLNEAITLYPKFAAAYFQKGLLSYRDNDFPKAIEAFVKAIEIKPDYLDAKFYFGVCHNNMRDFPVSEMVFRDVIQQKNDMPAAHMYLGIALIASKKLDEAQKELEQAITLKGGENLALAHKYLGGIYVTKKQNADAAKELQKYVTLSPKAPDAEKIKGTIADLKKQS